MNKICRNCGMLGHIYKNCKQPISSYGIIIYDKTNKKYLLIQRTNTIAFTEFVFGKYSLFDKDYITNMFARMTNDEIQLIKSKTKFNVLWNKIYSVNNYSKNMETISSKYNYFLEKYNKYLENFNSTYNECEWEFPKGRRNNNESDLECACREFNEETNINLSDIEITNQKFSEKYKSCNNVTYLHVYYLAYARNNIILDKKPCAEIYQIKWLSYIDADKYIRSYSLIKKKVLKEVEQVVDLH